MFIFSFISLSLGDMATKILLVGYLNFPCLVSYRTFMVSLLIFMSFIHSVVWCELVVVSDFCMCQSRSPNTIYWRRCLYFIVCSSLLCQILIDHRDLGLFLGSLFCSFDVCVCSYVSTRLFWSWWPCSVVWYQASWFLLLCPSFSRLLRLFWFFFVFI